MTSPDNHAVVEGQLRYGCRTCGHEQGAGTVTALVRAVAVCVARVDDLATSAKMRGTTCWGRRRSRRQDGHLRSGSGARPARLEWPNGSSRRIRSPERALARPLHPSGPERDKRGGVSHRGPRRCLPLCRRGRGSRRAGAGELARVGRLSGGRSGSNHGAIAARSARALGGRHGSPRRA